MTAGEALQKLAVLGDDFDLFLGAAFTGLTAPELLTILTEAESEGTLRIDGGRVGFDPARRRGLAAGLGAAAGAQAHARAAELLERLRPNALKDIARHRAAAIAVVGVEAVLSAYENALTMCLRAYDWSSAEALLEEAVAIADLHGDPRRDSLALRRAQALYRAGRFAQAVEVCRSLAREARSRGDSRLLAEAAIVVQAIGDREVCATLLDLCLEALPGLAGDDALRARVLAQQARLQAELTRSPADLQLCTRALNLAEGSGDVRALAESLHALQMAQSGAREVEERLTLADRLEALAGAGGLDEYLGRALSWRVDALFQTGRRPALDEAIGRLEEYGQNRADALSVWKARMAWALLAQVEGRFADAERLGEEAVTIARRGGHEMADFVFLILLSGIKGRTGAGGDDDGRIHGVPLGSEAIAAYPAMEAAIRGDREQATLLFERSFPVRRQLLNHELEVGAYAALALTAWSLERAEAAPQLHEDLEPFADQMAVSATGQAASLGSVSRFLGQMAALAGRWETMEVDFARALRRNMEFGDRPATAETRFDWARALLRRGLGRDRERVQALLLAAGREAEALGMRPLLQKVRHLQAELRSAPSHPLSVREAEVAGLVAAGLSNKEIAARLRLSVRTAEKHLLNIMNKLGAENRAQVAAWMTRTQAAPLETPTR